MTGPDAASELASGLESAAAAAAAVGLEEEDDVVVFVLVAVAVAAVRIDADAFAGSVVAPEPVFGVVVAASAVSRIERWSELAEKAMSGAAEALVAAQMFAADGSGTALVQIAVSDLVEAGSSVTE